MHRRTKIMIALAIVVGNVASFLLIFDPGTDFSSPPPPRPYVAPYVPPKVPLIEVPVKKFDTIIATFYGTDTTYYPEHPYTLEIDSDGKIKFRNEVIPNGAEGKISPAQVAVLLKSLNDNNFEFLAKVPPPSTGTTFCPSHRPYADIAATVDGIKMTPVTENCLLSWHFKEYRNLEAEIEKAGEAFIKTSFLKAAENGNQRAKCWLNKNNYICALESTNPSTTSP